MSEHASLLDELRTQYEAARVLSHEHSDVPGFQEIDAQLRKAFRWLEKAITYLDGLHPPIDHRFDLGHGIVFNAPRFERGFVGQHEKRIVGFPGRFARLPGASGDAFGMLFRPLNDFWFPSKFGPCWSTGLYGAENGVSKLEKNRQ